MRLSPSSISTFQKCPKKFYYNYIEEVPSLQPKNLQAMEIGRAVHKTIESFYSDRDDDRMLTEGEIEIELSKALDSIDFDKYVEEGKFMNNLSGFVDFEIWRQKKGMKLLETEEYYRNDGLSGRIDALFENGKKICVDFKSGYGKRDHTLQGEIYRRLTGADEVLIAYTIWNQRQKIEQKEKKWLDDILRNVREKIDNEEFGRNEEHCPDCEFSPFCHFEGIGLNILDL